MNFDLDVDSPDKVSRVLRNAAQAYHESASELAAAWGERGAGIEWSKIARVLDAAADKIDKLL